MVLTVIGASLGPETGLWLDQAKMGSWQRWFLPRGGGQTDGVIAGDWPANTAPFNLLVSEAVHGQHERPPFEV